MVSTTQLSIETKIAPVGKSYSALDFQDDVVVCVNGGANVCKHLDNIEIIAVSRALRPHTRHDFTRRQHIFRLALIYRQTHFRRLPFDSTKRSGNISHRVPNDVKLVGVRNKLETLVENIPLRCNARLA